MDAVSTKCLLVTSISANAIGKSKETMESTVTTSTVIVFVKKTSTRSEPNGKAR